MAKKMAKKKLIRIKKNLMDLFRTIKFKKTSQELKDEDRYGWKG